MRDPLLNFRLPPELTAELDRVAAARGVTRSAIMREAVAYIIEQHQPEQQETAA